MLFFFNFSLISIQQHLFPTLKKISILVLVSKANRTSNDAENSNLHHSNKLYFKVY